MLNGTEMEENGKVYDMRIEGEEDVWFVGIWQRSGIYL